MGRELINPLMTVSVKDGKPKFDNPELFRRFCSEQPDGKYTIAIEHIETHFIRSKQFNKYYRKVVIRKGLCPLTGYSEEEAHETMKYFFARKYDPNKPGEFTIERTRDMNPIRFKKYVERVKDFVLGFFGVRIPEPNEIVY